MRNLSLFSHIFFQMIFFTFLSFKVVQMNETYVNAREEFAKQQQLMIERQKKIEAEISKRIAEAELEEANSQNSGIIEYSDTKIISIEPSRIPANSNFEIIVNLDPAPKNKGFCKFGTTLRSAMIYKNGSISCVSPLLSIGEVYFSFSEDKQKWTIPSLITVYDQNAPSYSTNSILIFVGLCIGAFAFYRILMKSMKKKKGHKHKYDDPMNQEQESKPKRKKHSKKLPQVVERETV